MDEEVGMKNERVDDIPPLWRRWRGWELWWMEGWSHGESGDWSSVQRAKREGAGLQRRMENAKKLYLLLMSINKERPFQRGGAFTRSCGGQKNMDGLLRLEYDEIMNECPLRRYGGRPAGVMLTSGLRSMRKQ